MTTAEVLEEVALDLTILAIVLDVPELDELASRLICLIDNPLVHIQ